MSRDINLTSKEWCDIVFEGKNQKYGAYYLRKTSSRRHLNALLMIVCVSAGLVILPTLIKQVIPKRAKMDGIAETIRMVNVQGITEPEPEPLQQAVQVEAPPPPAMKEAIKFTPPVIDPNATDEETMRTQTEVTKSKAVIFDEDIIGTNDPNAVDPRTLVKVVEEVTQAPPPKPKAKEILITAEVMPSFPGGEAAMFRYLQENARYTAIALEHGIQGRVIVKFAVMEDGSISNITILRSLHPSLDNEAIRVVKSMPKWLPGMQNGHPASVYFQLPVTFKLEQ